MIKRLQSITGKPAPIFALAVIFVIWFVICDNELIPAFMLPSPVDVIKAFSEDFGLMMRHTLITLEEALYGLGIGIALAFIISTLMDRFEFLHKAIYPIMIITQTIPTIAIAPLLVIWMGFGMAPKITLVVITTFFPIAVGLLDGYKSADSDAINLIRAMGANRFQIFRYVKMPSAIGHFFAGLRVSASYAVVGAVISEWLGGFEGLGVYMTRAKKAYAFDKMFAVIVLVSLVSLLLMALVSLIQRISMPWNKK